MKRFGKISIIIAALALVAAACNKRDVPETAGYAYKDGTAVLAGKTIDLETARDAAKKEAGLSGQRELTDSQGMIFIYGFSERPHFWMKGMLFDIDILWIKDDKIVDISRNAKSEPGVEDIRLRRYQPNTEVNAVLELKSGWADRHGVKVGDEISIDVR